MQVFAIFETFSFATIGPTSGKYATEKKLNVMAIAQKPTPQMFCEHLSKNPGAPPQKETRRGC